MTIPITLRRGLTHMFIGLIIPAVALFLPRMVLLISLGAVTFIFLALELLRLKAPVINKWFIFFLKPLMREGESSRLTGASYMLVASLIAFLVFQRDIAVLALCFLAVGDPLATIFGRHMGKRKLFGKTVEGCLACLVSCVAVGLVGYYAGLDIRLLTALMGALAAAVIEAMPLPINDNLTIPLFAGLVMMLVAL